VTEEEMVWAASIAVGKNWDYTELYYSDCMYGKETHANSVWDYVIQAKEKGMDWFRQEYSAYKIFKV